MERQSGRRMDRDAALFVELSVMDTVFAGLYRERIEESPVRRKLDLAPIDALLEHFQVSPITFPFSEQVLDDLALVIAFHMDPPQEFFHGILLKLVDFLAGMALCIISSYVLKKMNQYRSDELAETLYLWFALEWSGMMGSLRQPSGLARRMYRDAPKPSRICYPRTGQLGFVDHIVQNLEELLKAKSDSIGPLKFYILRIQPKLLHLSCLLMEVPDPRKEEADLKDLMESITNLAYEVEYVIDSSLVKDIPIWYCVLWLQDILQELKSTEREVNMEFGRLQPIVTNILNFKAIGLNIIPIFNNNTDIREKLSDVFNHPDVRQFFPIRTWSLVSSSYKERKKEVFLQLLQNASYASWIPDRLKVAFTSDMSEDELERSVAKLLYSFSCFIILEDVRDTDAVNDLRRVLRGCRLISVLLTTPSPQLAVLFRSQQDMSAYHTSTSQTNKPTTDDDVVGFKAETERMLELLIRGPMKLRTISIFGMPGQGKTTLTKKLYDDPLVVDYFDVRTWCYVSQVYEKRVLLLELLGQIVQLFDAIHHMDDEELAAMLCKSLRGRRFLVVLDDVWSIGAWNDLGRCFPNDNNGSRIIFTTRLQELASQSGSMLQPLGPLSDDESWVLLEKKLFQKESCPAELLGVGRQIAKRCKGLPLSVILTAGILAKMEKKKDCWKQTEKSLSSCILGEAKAWGKGVIELSYKHLPDHIKPCFLYLGAFLDDREVPVRKLIRLWIAEGFLKYTHLKSLEDVAEGYLTDLIGRSLVTVVQEKSKGGVKSCRVHDLLRDFCLIKAKEENFLQLIRGYDELFTSSNDNVDYGLDSDDSYTSTPIEYHLRRLCIYSKRNHFIMLKPCGPFVRSLLFFASNDMCPSYSYDISFIYDNFKILRILDLEDINTGDAFKGIDMLVHLKYLAVQVYVDFIPSSIANLWNLETFCVKALEGKVVKVPDSIWDMAKLRHLHINDNPSFVLEPHRLENSSILGNLQTFSTPSLAYGDDMEKIVRRLRGLQNLKCIFLDSWDDDKNCNQFPLLGFLSQLVSVKVFYNGEGKYPCEFNFPSNLKKLTLSNFRMPWNEISQLATLRNLEVLKLLGNAFEGEIWEMEDEVFLELKFLKLDTLNIVQWSATNNHFPHLERLLLHKCEQLEEIPHSIGDIPTLQMIEVMWCNPSAAISAIKIQEEQLDFGNEGLKLHVHPKIWDLESSS